MQTNRNRTKQTNRWIPHGCISENIAGLNSIKKAERKSINKHSLNKCIYCLKQELKQ